MGQYHYTVNLDKREFIHPHKLAAGLKLAEQIGSHVGDALIILLACSNGRGGGDIGAWHKPDRTDADMNDPFPQDEAQWIGHWAGDRIAVVGDYAEDADLPDGIHAADILGGIEDGSYTDITEPLIPIIEREAGVTFVHADYCANKDKPLEADSCCWRQVNAA